MRRVVGNYIHFRGTLEIPLSVDQSVRAAWEGRGGRLGLWGSDSAAFQGFMFGVRGSGSGITLEQKRACAFKLDLATISCLFVVLGTASPGRTVVDGEQQTGSSSSISSCAHQGRAVYESAASCWQTREFGPQQPVGLCLLYRMQAVRVVAPVK